MDEDHKNKNNQTVNEKNESDVKEVKSETETNDTEIKENRPEEVNEPEENKNEPEENKNEPVENKNEPVENKNEPEENTNEPEENKNEPEENTNEPEENTNEPVNEIDYHIEDITEPVNKINDPIDGPIDGHKIEFIISEEEWKNSDHQVKLNKKKFYASKSSEWLPDKELRLGETKRSGHKLDQDNEKHDYFAVDDKAYSIKKLHTSFLNKIVNKELGWVQVTNPDNNSVGYVLVKRFRYILVLLLLLILLLLYSLHLTKDKGVAPQMVPQFIADQVGITNVNKDVRADISYSAYQSVADTTWIAGQTHQDITLALPATVTWKDSYGREQTSTNPVDAAPHIYLDLNHDDEFTEDECVFNPMKKDADGNIEDIGNLLQPGNQITSIDLVKPVDAGVYPAECVWTGLTTEGHELANPMTFKFTITVK